jgi:hypothetical protein
MRRVFPQAWRSETDAIRDYTLGGQLRIASQHGPYAWTVSPGDKPDSRDGWKGISGAAVCKIAPDNELHVLGALESVPADFSGGLLDVARLSAAFVDEGFCNELRFSLGCEPRIVPWIVSTPSVQGPASGIADSQRLTRRHPSIFVERTELHNQLLAQLGAAISYSTSIAVVLRGPRGSGKSTIADDLCDRVEVTVHRVLASSETDLRSIGQNDLVFIDGFMDDKGRYEAEAWLGSIPSRFYLITTRLSEATAAIQNALKNRGTQV